MLLALLASLSIADTAANELHFHGVVRLERGGAVEQRGYGLSPETGFWVASISKSFTAALVVRLAELGKLRLEDRVLGSDLTFDELLTHTSGLPRTSYVAEGVFDAREAAAKILRLPRGEKGRFAYTSDGYTLLAIAAEKAGGAPFFDLLQREVLDRAGLRHTGFWPRCLRGVRVARLSRPPRGARAKENWGFKGGEGICSTAEDLARLVRAIAAGKIVARPEMLFEKRVAISDGFAGRGFFISASGTVWTRGTEDYGHNAVVKLLANGDLIAALSDVPAIKRDDVAPSRALGDLLEIRLSSP
jgi:CubicO group peptidase (beta-lactamase class C family)